MISSKAFRLYLRYKVNSRNLFNRIDDEPASRLSTLRDDDLGLYWKELKSRYAESAICFTARKRYRDLYVPPDQRDAGHEAAINKAGENCRAYAHLLLAVYKELQKRGQLGAKQGGPENTGAKGIARKQKRKRRKANDPVAGLGDEKQRDNGPEGLDETFRQFLEEAQYEAEQQKNVTEELVMAIYTRLEEHLHRLKVTDAEAPQVMISVIVTLLPGLSRADFPQTGWDWSDERLITRMGDLVRKTDLDEEKVLNAVIKSAVNLRRSTTVMKKIEEGTSEREISLPPRLTDLEKAAVLLQLVYEAASIGINGLSMHDVPHLVHLRSAAQHYRRTGNFPTLYLKEPLPIAKGRLKLDPWDGYVYLAKVISEGIPTQVTCSPLKSTQWAVYLRSFRSAWRKLNVQRRFTDLFTPLLAKTLAHLMGGTVHVEDVLIHPAKFLQQAEKMPDDRAIAFAYQGFINPGSRRDYNAGEVLMHLTYELVKVARDLYSLQFPDRILKYLNTGRISLLPRERNPFDDFPALMRAKSYSTMDSAKGDSGQYGFERGKVYWSLCDESDENGRRMCVESDKLPAVEYLIEEGERGGA